MSESAIVRIPRSSANDNYALITRLYAQSGQMLKAGELIAEIETTKTQIEIHAPVAGPLRLLCQEGDRLMVGAAMAHIGQPAAEILTEAGRFTLKARKLMRQHHLSEESFAHLARVKEEHVQQYVREKLYYPLAETHHKKVEVEQILANPALPYQSVTSLTLKTAPLDEFIQQCGLQISIPDLLLFHVSRLLKSYPRLNGFYQQGPQGYRQVNLGMTLNMQGLGLKIVTIRNADQLSLKDLAAQIKELQLRYLRQELTPQELSGASFTLTSLFHLGVTHFVPLLPPQQAAILAVSAPQDTGTIEITLSFDHRQTDGMEAADFLNALRLASATK